MGSADKRATKSRMTGQASEHSSAYLDVVPLPLALWDASRRSGRFNSAALELLKFSQEELQTQPNLWLQQVYDKDLLAWHAQLRRFSIDNNTVVCDYRFFPKNAAEPIWLREVIMPLKAPHPLWFSMSAYTDITDLKSLAEHNYADPPAPSQTHEESLRGLFHDINNKLQRLSMEIELAGLESQLQSEATRKFSDSLASVTQALAVIHERVIGAKSNS